MTYKSNTRKERIAARRCVNCNEPLDNDRKAQNCKVCQKIVYGKKVARTQKRRDLGLCLCGGIPLPGKKQCQKCTDEHYDDCQKRLNVWSSQGLCTECGKCPCMESFKNNAISGQKCEECYLKELSKRHTGTVIHHIDLKNMLISQNWKCAYSGDLLVLGSNATIDHMMPQKRFPELAKDINNLQWVTREINEMKFNRTPKEFLSLVDEILCNSKYTTNSSINVVTSI